MGVKENFISLFAGHEEEIENLPDRFHLKDFTYMYTSQRTMRRIKNKFNLIEEGGNSGQKHGNFWVDLRNLGLVKIDIKEMSEFGYLVSRYFDDEQDEFKREHFVLSGIRQKSFDVSEEVFNGYNNKVQELLEFLQKIPVMNQEGRELINNQEKLHITGFLNIFPVALRRYFELSESQQEEIDSLREFRLKKLFSKEGPQTPYTKIANRLQNIWRAPKRRVNFVKSVILSEYEEKVDEDINHKIPFVIIETYSKILNENILKEIIAESDNLKITEEEGNTYIELRTLKLPDIPKKRRAKRSHEIKRRIVSRRKIANSEQLRRDEGEEPDKPLPSVDPSELQLRNEMRREKTREHQEIVIKFYEFYSQRGIQADENNFDLLVEKNNTVLLHEMKTITEKNERSQIIKATGQLFYYEYHELPSILKSDDANIIKMAVFQKKPRDEVHINYMKSLGINVYWITENGEISGEEESMEFLAEFVGT